MRRASWRRLKEKVVINCPGYAARALWKDESVVPVRGQIAWLIPQPEVDYGVIYDGVNMVPRRDGIVLQMLDGGDMRGYGDDHETPDPAEAKTAVDAGGGAVREDEGASLIKSALPRESGDPGFLTTNLTNLTNGSRIPEVSAACSCRS